MSLLIRGKSKDVYENTEGTVEIHYTNRLSAYDVPICDNVPNKGESLGKLTSWWFKNTSHIIPNHFISYADNILTAHKCQVIPIEFVIRGYMTGSLWKEYEKGSRVFCGVTFRDGYKMNDKLDIPCITPTTKSNIKDMPITYEEILDIIPKTQLDYIYDKTYQLFEYGQQVCAEKGLILVDTKYEFGIKDGIIMLVDEIHTCDSSRFWLSSDMNINLDKDIIRKYIANNNLIGKPYPEIPDELVKKTSEVYMNLYLLFSKSK